MSEPLTYTLKEVVDLERPAWHEDGRGEVDFIYDGITFWRERIGNLWKPELGERLPPDHWHHKDNCRCPRCREAKGGETRRRRRASKG